MTLTYCAHFYSIHQALKGRLSPIFVYWGGAGDMPCDKWSQFDGSVHIKVSIF